MKRLRIWLFLAIILTILIVLSGCASRSITKPKIADVPTLCFHGLGGSYKDVLPFVKEAEKERMSNCVIRADVNEHGRVKLKGKIKGHSKNPIIMVNYKDNVQPNFARNGFYATQVVKALHKNICSERLTWLAIHWATCRLFITNCKPICLL